MKYKQNFKYVGLKVTMNKNNEKLYISLLYFVFIATFYFNILIARSLSKHIVLKTVATYTDVRDFPRILEIPIRLYRS